MSDSQEVIEGVFPGPENVVLTAVKRNEGKMDAMIKIQADLKDRVDFLYDKKKRENDAGVFTKFPIKTLVDWESINVLIAEEQMIEDSYPLKRLVRQ